MVHIPSLEISISFTSFTRQQFVMNMLMTVFHLENSLHSNLALFFQPANQKSNIFFLICQVDLLLSSAPIRVLLRAPSQKIWPKNCQNWQKSIFRHFRFELGAKFNQPIKIQIFFSWYVKSTFFFHLHQSECSYGHPVKRYDPKTDKNFEISWNTKLRAWLTFQKRRRTIQF